ncbi:TPA: glycosyltransferase family 25 protein [Proteus mirabilis]|nr:glycosyltransferase family 25 protein [Proteus mirabilis]ATC73998.1 hypothetical protein BG257_04995 [Proteus mirabilis]ATC77313.1 hypothetical protein BG029_02120 [Proteus mirabilis]ELA7643341.1 glycosyltransferase family 25 protein [Proteus mirabilis]ELA7800285.1 glycosyltransferase family 25 protein [Proteus mirabilis]EMF0795251.1 glycosyltransferase family 25 protein [Proteus mirabilis]
MNISDIDICIISLESDIGRREKLKNNLAHYKLTPRVSNAINGKKLSAEDYFLNAKAKTSKFNGRTMLTPSELGCFLSHKKAIYEFLEGKKKYLLILEDDVTIENNILNLFSNINFLEENSIYILGGQDGLNSFNRVILSKKNNIGFSKVRFNTHRWIYRTCCYLITQETAKKLYSFMNKNTYMADDWKFIIKNTSIKNIYYSYFFSHPIDLKNSHIEKEREYLNK